MTYSRKYSKSKDILNSTFEDFDSFLKNDNSIDLSEFEDKLYNLEKLIKSCPSSEDLKNLTVTMNNLNTLVSTFDKRIKILENSSEEYFSRISKIENRIFNYEENSKKLENISKDCKNFEHSIENIKTEISKNNGNISTLQTSILNLQTGINGFRSCTCPSDINKRINIIESAHSELVDTTSDHDDKLISLELQIKNSISSLNNIESSIKGIKSCSCPDNLSKQILDLNSKINLLDENDNTLKIHLLKVQDKVEETKDSVDSMSGRIDETENDLSLIEDSVSKIKNLNNSNQNLITSLQGRIIILESKPDLENRLSQNEQKLKEVSVELEKLKPKEEIKPVEIKPIEVVPIEEKPEEIKLDNKN